MKRNNNNNDLGEAIPDHISSSDLSNFNFLNFINGLPCIINCSSDKRPLTRNFNKFDQSDDGSFVWAGTRYNPIKSNTYGIVCNEMNNIEVIDLDIIKDGDKPGVISGVDWFKENIGDPEKQDTLVIKTQSGGYHLYYKYGKLDFENKSCLIKNVKIDFRGKGKGYVCYNEDKYKVVVNKPPSIAPDIISEKINSYAEKKVKKVKKEKKEKEEKNETLTDEKKDFEKKVNNTVFSMIMEKLDQSRSDNYSDWINVGFICKNRAHETGENEFYLEMFKKFSKRSAKYNEYEVQKVWDSLPYRNDGLKVGSLLYYLKHDNIDFFSTLGFSSDDDKQIDQEENKWTVYRRWKKEFEKTFFMLNTGSKNVVTCLNKEGEVDEITDVRHDVILWGLCTVDRDYKHLTNYKFPDDFNQFSFWVYNDAFIRRYIKYDFLPYPAETNSLIYNMFTPPIEKKELGTSDFVRETFENFILHICSDRVDCKDYLINYLAHAIQYPGIKPGVGFVLSGDEGTGKGTLTNLTTKIFTSDYVHQVSDVENALGRFNHVVSKKLFLFFDEIDYKSLKDKYGKLRNLITDTTINIEKKGKDIRLESSFHRLIITTNYDNVVNLSNTDRRFVIFKTIKIDQSLADDVYKIINDPNMILEVRNYLRNYELKYKTLNEFQLNRPITEEYKSSKEDCIPIHYKFLNYLINNYEEYNQEIEIYREKHKLDEDDLPLISHVNNLVEGNYLRIRNKTLGIVYGFFVGGENESNKSSTNSLNYVFKKFKETGAVSEKKNNAVRDKVIDINKLKQWFSEKKYTFETF